MYELSGNIRKTRDTRAPSPKLREDGTNYPYRMFFDNNARIIDADSLAELINMIIPGYLEMSDIEKRDARRAKAKGIAFGVRVNVLAGITQEVADGLSEWEWEVLSSDEPLHSTFPLEKIDSTSEEIKLWTSTTPLVVAEEDFYPHTEYVMPMSSEGSAKYLNNLIVIRSATESDFLDTLVALGQIVYGSPRVAPTPALR